MDALVLHDDKCTRNVFIEIIDQNDVDLKLVNILKINEGILITNGSINDIISEENGIVFG